MTDTTTTPSVTVVCSGLMPITMVVILAPISLGQTILGKQDDNLLPQFISGDTVRGSIGLHTMPQKQQP